MIIIVSKKNIQNKTKLLLLTILLKTIFTLRNLILTILILLQINPLKHSELKMRMFHQLKSIPIIYSWVTFWVLINLKIQIVYQKLQTSVLMTNDYSFWFIVIVSITWIILIINLYYILFDNIYVFLICFCLVIKWWILILIPKTTKLSNFYFNV